MKIMRQLLKMVSSTRAILTMLFILGLSYAGINSNFAQGNKTNMNSLQLEILEVQLNKSTRVDITPLVKKYIPVGMPETEARKILKNAGFRISEINIKFADPSVMAVWEHKKGFMSQREARIVFKVSESKITSIVGDVLYHSI